MAVHHYTAYGLHIASEFQLPELQSAPGTGSPDVTVRYGYVPASLPEVSANGIAWQSSEGQLLLNVHQVGRYLIVEDREIRVQPSPSTTDEDIRLFLLGSVLGALLHGRHILVLHASVIQTAKGAVLFMGRSGSGKSTLLGAFLQRGYKMLTDDKAGIVVDSNGAPVALPGMPFLRLTEDAVRKLGFPVDGIIPNSTLDKYVVPVDRFCDRQIPVCAAYSVAPHNRADIILEQVKALDRFEALTSQIYRGRFVRYISQRQAVFKTLGTVAAGTGVAKVRWPDYPCRISELVDRIEQDLN
jgi:hypothetical protein